MEIPFAIWMISSSRPTRTQGSKAKLRSKLGLDRWTDNYVASVDTLNPGYSTMTNEKTPVFHLQRGSEELPWDAVWNRGLHGWLWKDCWSFMDLAE